MKPYKITPEEIAFAKKLRTKKFSILQIASCLNRSEITVAKALKRRKK